MNLIYRNANKKEGSWKGVWLQLVKLSIRNMFFQFDRVK